MRKINPNVRAILSTGYDLDGKAQEIVDEGMAGFLQKPYEIQAVGEKLKEILGAFTEQFKHSLSSEG